MYKSGYLVEQTRKGAKPDFLFTEGAFRGYLVEQTRKGAGG